MRLFLLSRPDHLVSRLSGDVREVCAGQPATLISDSSVDRYLARFGRLLSDRILPPAPFTAAHSPVPAPFRALIRNVAQ